MAEQEAREPPTVGPAASGEGQGVGGGAGSRPIRLLDPFAIWYRPQVLLPGRRQALRSAG